MALLTDRIWSKIDVGLCWEWTAYRNPFGYGRLQVAGRMVYAHRLVWECLVGEIPDGLELDHLCRNHACVNPDHLEPVTHAENMRRGSAGAWQRMKTHCKHGHVFDAPNTYVFKGKRECRACRRQATAKWQKGRR